MEKEKLESQKTENTMPKGELISLVFEMGYTIAIPIVLFALLGRWLDRSFGTSPLFILVGVLISIAISSFIVYRKISKLLP